jgi:hypothetical protein
VSEWHTCRRVWLVYKKNEKERGDWFSILIFLSRQVHLPFLSFPFARSLLPLALTLANRSLESEAFAGRLKHSAVYTKKLNRERQKEGG